MISGNSAHSLGSPVVREELRPLQRTQLTWSSTPRTWPWPCICMQLVIVVRKPAMNTHTADCRGAQVSTFDIRRQRGNYLPRLYVIFAEMRRAFRRDQRRFSPTSDQLFAQVLPGIKQGQAPFKNGMGARHAFLDDKKLTACGQ